MSGPLGVYRRAQDFRMRIARRVAATAARHAITFVIGSIVPWMRRAWMTLKMTVAVTNAVWARRQNLTARRLRQSAKAPAASKAHIAVTPQAEKGVGER